jgi:hypothetical protein
MVFRIIPIIHLIMFESTAWMWLKLIRILQQKLISLQKHR